MNIEDLQISARDVAERIWETLGLDEEFREKVIEALEFGTLSVDLMINQVEDDDGFEPVALIHQIAEVYMAYQQMKEELKNESNQELG